MSNEVSTGLHYAVIEALRNDDGSECAVIGYRNQDSLWDLIAARSIVGLGFASRDEAAASIQASSLFGGLTQTPQNEAATGRNNSQPYPSRTKARFLTASSVEKYRQVIVLSAHGVLTAVVFGFYSRSAVLTTIRIFLGLGSC